MKQTIAIYDPAELDLYLNDTVMIINDVIVSDKKKFTR